MNKLLALGGSLLLAAICSMPVLAAPAADEILVANPYARAVPPVSQNSALFMTLKNTGTTDRAVVSAASRAAKVVELHTHIHDDGVMRMREVERIDIEAGESTVLEPGGLHVMLLGLKRPLAVGSTVQVDLTFDDGSTKSVVAPVRAVGDMHHGEGQAMPAAAAPAEPLSPVFVNLTSDDAWRAGMALHWTHMALQRGHGATVWLNVEAVRIAVNGIAHPIHAMQDKSAQEMLQDVIAAGGTVYVCGGCLKRAGFAPGDLIDGVAMGHPDKVMPAIFDPATKVISW
jgi:copper(I)-binding protein/predicted peroxiredoxin